jgi:DNA topoisomerase-1
MACSAFPKCRNAKPLPGDKAADGKARAKSGGKAARKAPARRKSRTVPTDRDCPDCGAKLVIRSGRRGKFLGCSAYPKCRHTENLPDELKETANAEGA